MFPHPPKAVRLTVPEPTTVADKVTLPDFVASTISKTFDEVPPTLKLLVVQLLALPE